MKIKCPYCFEVTRHRIKYLPGEKESCYKVRCGKCGEERLMARYEIEDIKKQVDFV